MMAAALVAALTMTAAVVTDARAQDRHDRGPAWHGDIRTFHEHDFDRWRGGHWFNGRHGGRAGWWWIVGGVYYFYPSPVYPYPDPYEPPVVAAPVPPPPQFWSYCPTAQAYYPYVATCNVPWQRVPAGSPPPG